MFLVLLPDLLASNLCTGHIKRIERLEGIPHNLLLAMAHVESGRYDATRKSVEPWPWTVQSQGKSNYFNSRHEAVSYVHELMKKGIKNIDIGCMQMNVEHHSHKFPSIDHMFDPGLNVGQGAKYLKQLKEQKKQGWSTAVGNYHSFTPEFHDRYKTKVFKKLAQVNNQPGVYSAKLEASKGSLYGRSETTPADYRVNASLYSYSRSHGLTGARKPVQPRIHKVVKNTTKSRVAMMKSRGIKGLEFMEKSEEP